MGNSLESFEKEIKQHIDWEKSYKFNLRTLEIRKKLFSECLIYFAYPENRTQYADKLIWNLLILETIHLWDELHSSNIRKILEKLAPEFLMEYSFFKDKEFRKIEEENFSLDIPKKAWDNFWLLVDTFKNDHLISFYDTYHYTKSRYERNILFSRKNIRLDQLIDLVPEKGRPLSPFHWSLPILLALGNLVTDVNALLWVNTAGVSGASLIAGYVTTATATIYMAKHDDLDQKRNKRFIDILKERLVKGEISQAEFESMKKTIEES